MSSGMHLGGDGACFTIDEALKIKAFKDVQHE